ncbi:MAG: kelch-like protein, partial [Proteobacteria bacterium]|nr:kelch-like protein [Pseudomonadota bacterium]
MRFFLAVVATLLLEAFPVDFALADGFVATPPMPTAREAHTATELNTHKVLVVGGVVPVSGSGVSVATTALYDPAVNTWAGGPSMGTARSGHTAVLLNGGKVLVVGGVDNTGAALASAEVYDPAVNTWTPVASMSQARTCHTATLLVPSNKVLIAGGSSDRYCYLNAFASSEIYDPVANTWSAGGAMTTPRVGHTATLLLGGSVLAAGGFTGGNSGSFPVQTERYNPTTNTWSASGA